MKNFKVIFLGDTVGPASVEYVAKNLWKLRKEYDVDAAVVNGENCAAGNGIDKDGVSRLISGGADVVTTGNHVFKRFEAERLLEDEPRVLRPANFPPSVSGSGFSIVDTGRGRLLIINLLGIINMEPLGDPFACADKILKENEGKYDYSFIDFHAEATSEKAALAFYLDGRVGAVAGTHTHVQTADEQILPGGTAFITDVGMCGSMNGVLGIKTECILHKFMIHTPVRFEEAKGDEALHGAVFEIDAASGKCLSVETIVR